jgi:hypothetical protein
MQSSEKLDYLIRSTITELMESAPPAPSLDQLDEGIAIHIERRRTWDPPPRNLHLPFVALGAAVVAAIVLIAVLVVPEPGRHQSAAAASELHEIANHALRQSSPQLGQGQWLLTKENVTLFANIGSVGSKATPNAEGTATLAISQWSNLTGQSYVSATGGPVTFASDANRTAWQAAGLLIVPNGLSNVSILQGAGAINVSNLPTNPAMLAQELSDGTTGIVALNQAAPGGLGQAAAILIGPTVGETPQLTSALYNALALMPGVTSLGNIETTSGRSGAGFSLGSAGEVIVDPATGALLEAQNIRDQAFIGLGRNYLSPQVSQDGSSGSIDIRQFVPIEAPTVAPLPSGVTPPAGFGSSGTITATAKPGVTAAQIRTFYDSQIQPVWGKASVSLNNMLATPVVTFEFNESQAQVQGFASLLNSSGLFVSVVVAPGNPSL